MDEKFSSDLKQRILDNFKDIWEKFDSYSKELSKLTSDMSAHNAEWAFFKESQKEKIDQLIKRNSDLGDSIEELKRVTNSEFLSLKKETDRLLPNAFKSIITILSVIVGLILGLIALTKYIAFRSLN